MSSRALHFVGSLPPEIAPDDETALRLLLDQADDADLTALPCDTDPLWIIDHLLSRPRVVTDTGNRVFETLREGDGTTYRTMPVYRLAEGVRLQPEHVSLNRVARCRSTVELFRKIRAEHPAHTHLRHQISLPAPLDLALFTFTGPPFDPDSSRSRLWQALRRLPLALTALKHLPVFTEAARDEIAELCATDALDIVFQYETPAVLIALSVVPRPLRRRLASLLAAQAAGLLTTSPATARFIVHLCHGDLDHKSLNQPRDTSDQVLFLNALAREMRAAGRPLPAVHLPLTHADLPPSIDPRFYEPLRKLDPDYQVVAGVVAEKHPAYSSTALRLTEQALGRPATAVGTACGLGRRSADDATDAVRATRLLAHDTPTPTPTPATTTRRD